MQRSDPRHLLGVPGLALAHLRLQLRQLPPQLARRRLVPLLPARARAQSTPEAARAGGRADLKPIGLGVVRALDLRDSLAPSGEVCRPADTRARTARGRPANIFK